MVKYRTVVADPPWAPTMSIINGGSPKASPQTRYQTMSVAQIASLRIPSANQSHLWLWCLAQHIDWGYIVARAWGFEPVICLTWEKPGLGVGHFRCNTEHIVLARRGSRHGNPFGEGRHKSATNGTCFHWSRKRHSEKPDEFYDMVEQGSPGPYLELFARRQRLGWDTWGNE